MISNSSGSELPYPEYCVDIFTGPLLEDLVHETRENVTLFCIQPELNGRAVSLNIRPKDIRQ